MIIVAAISWQHIITAFSPTQLLFGSHIQLHHLWSYLPWRELIGQPHKTLALVLMTNLEDNSLFRSFLSGFFYFRNIFLFGMTFLFSFHAICLHVRCCVVQVIFAKELYQTHCSTQVLSQFCNLSNISGCATYPFEYQAVSWRKWIRDWLKKTHAYIQNVVVCFAQILSVYSTTY